MREAIREMIGMSPSLAIDYFESDFLVDDRWRSSMVQFMRRELTYKARCSVAATYRKAARRPSMRVRFVEPERMDLAVYAELMGQPCFSVFDSYCL